jgi:hypothetical protein
MVASIGLLVVAGALIWVVSNDSAQQDASYLSGSYTGDSTAYFQQYLRGHPAFVSSPELISSSASPLTVVLARPDVVGSCQVRVIAQEAYSAAGPSAGYFPTGPFTAAYELGRVVGIKKHTDIRRLTFDRRQPVQWFDTFTFSVPHECVVRIKGFTVVYSVGHSRATEFLSEKSTFIPVDKFHS